jgi:hypothetical protein
VNSYVNPNPTLMKKLIQTLSIPEPDLKVVQEQKKAVPSFSAHLTIASINYKENRLSPFKTLFATSVMVQDQNNWSEDWFSHYE